MAVALFFVPHQDDEVLAMGASIRHHVLAKETEPVVVLVTDGEASEARAEVNEKFHVSLTLPAFSDARDREFVDCLTRLGVPAKDIYFANLQDGALTLAQAKATIRRYVDHLEPVECHTLSFMDAHPDHYALGRTLDEMTRGGQLPKVRAHFWLSHRYLHDAPTPPLRTVKADDVVVTASTAYEVVDVDRFTQTDASTGPRYGIGYLSVDELFDDLRSHPVSYRHEDSSHFRTAADRKAANAWLKKNGRQPYL
jgi:LmbE family N-acetylglucosaminyl deacetylase